MKRYTERFHLSSQLLGVLEIKLNTEAISTIEFCDPRTPSQAPQTEFAKQILQDLTAYLSGSLKQFNHQLSPAPTEFQNRFRQTLLGIPYGQTKTYGELAKQLDSSQRAIGAACRANPVPVIVPCHRVVAANGIGGFSGASEGLNIERKQYLLDLEARF